MTNIKNAISNKAESSEILNAFTYQYWILESQKCSFSLYYGGVPVYCVWSYIQNIIHVTLQFISWAFFFFPLLFPIFIHLSDKSKRRTKTVKKSLEPKWNQTFMYSPVHRREFRERMLEITLWDQARVREEESEFLGEARQISPQLFV